MKIDTFWYKKKAIVAGELALIIIAIVIGIVVLTVTVIASKGVEMSVSDTLCKTTNAAKGNLAVGKILMPNFCRVKIGIKIDAEDWSKCDSKYKNDPESCATHQILKLALRCWNMYGRGDLNVANAPLTYGCFEIGKIYGLSENAKIEKKNFLVILNEQKEVCDKFKLCSDSVGWTEGDVITSKGNWEINFYDALGLLMEDYVKLVAM